MPPMAIASTGTIIVDPGVVDENESAPQTFASTQRKVCDGDVSVWGRRKLLGRDS